MLVRQRVVSSVSEAFQRYLREDTHRPLPRVGVPVQEAIALIRGAGGVAVWAHPAYDCRRKTVLELRSLGLQGLEVEYPGYRADRVKQMRQLAADLDLVISGGSDCHGPWPFYQTVGARGVTMRELEMIRNRAV
jgi:predicted metal-dependent phosphoesterase TrpH